MLSAKTFLKILLTLFLMGLFFSPVASAAILPKILPTCEPSLPPSDPNGCGIYEFVQLLRNIINFLTIIVFPIAAGVIIWGGIVIMTAGGSTERAAKGKKVITAAVIGIAIALGAWLIINGIYLALTGVGVESHGL